MLTLQPGVVATNASGTGISIRGGRNDEAATYVDGVPVTPGYRGSHRPLGTGEIGIGTSGFEEASVTTGRLLGRVRQCAVGHHQHRDQDRLGERLRRAFAS